MKYNQFGQGCDRQLSLIVKAIAPPKWDWHDAAKNIVQFYGDYGIFIDIVSEDFVVIDAARLGFDVIETSCIVQGRGTEEQSALYDFFDGQAVGNHGALVMIVGGIAETGPEGVTLRSLRGCSAHAPEKPLILLNARSATKWSLAHEVGHLLARGTPHVKHHPDPNNILHVDSAKLSSSPHMTQKQADAMRASSFLKTIA